MTPFIENRLKKDICPTCFFAPKDCFCASVTKITLPFQTHLFVQKSEIGKKSNSSKLIPLAFDPVSVQVRGFLGTPLDYNVTKDPKSTYILFPSKDSLLLDSQKAQEIKQENFSLILLDGTWSCAAKMANRFKKALPDATFLALPDFKEDRYFVRYNPHAERVSTFEAYLYFLKLMDYPLPFKELRQLFYKNNQALMNLRGSGSLDLILDLD